MKHPTHPRPPSQGWLLIAIEVAAVAVFAAAWGYSGLAIHLPWWVTVPYILVSILIVEVATQFLDRRYGALPAIEQTSRIATVTGLHRLDEDRPELVTVIVDGRDGDGFDSSIADVIAEDDKAKFAVNTQWNVYIFTATRAKVILAEDHDDILRIGYDLSGVRWDSERSLPPMEPEPGSALLSRKFRAK